MSTQNLELFLWRAGVGSSGIADTLWQEDEIKTTRKSVYMFIARYVNELVLVFFFSFISLTTTGCFCKM